MLQHFSIVCRHLLRGHAHGTFIANGKKIQIHVIKVRHGLFDPMHQIGMQLSQLQGKALQQRLSPGTGARQQLVDLGVGEVRVNIPDLQAHDFMAQGRPLGRIWKTAAAKSRGFERQFRIHPAQAEHQFGTAQCSLTQTQAQLTCRVGCAQ